MQANNIIHYPRRAMQKYQSLIKADRKAKEQGGK